MYRRTILAVASCAAASVWTIVSAHASDPRDAEIIAAFPYVAKILSERDRSQKYELIQSFLKNRKRISAVLSKENGIRVFNRIRMVAPKMPVNLRKINLVGSNLEFINLSRAKIYWSKLRNANLHRANLRSAYLYHCHCQSINLMLADLSPMAGDRRTELADSYLDKANLSQANLTGVDLGVVPVWQL